MSSDRLQSLQPGDPKRVGRYELLARLGVGGMGRVYLGRSQGGRTVAVKVVHPNLAGDPQFRRRFTLEVAAARRVGGFHTAQVVDADTDADPPWFVTEYIAGPSLQEAVDDHGPLPERSVAALGAGLAEGLTAIHNHDVIHRDLKPGNVLLATDGPRIIDFGIARAMDATSQTTRASLVGTPGFISPEQYRGREVGPASDVFCLAAVLVFAATGRRPFGEGPGDALGYRVVNEDPDLMGVPASLLPLIAAGLEKDPDDRPDVKEFLDRCSTLAEGEGLSLPTPVTTLINTRLAEAEALTATPKATQAKSAKVMTVENVPPPPGTTRVRPRASSSKPSAQPSSGQGVAAVVGALLVVAALLFIVNDQKEPESPGPPTSSTDGGFSTSDYSDYSDYSTEQPSPTPDPTREAFENISAGDCLDVYMDPYQFNEWSQDVPNTVDCDRTDAYTRVIRVEDSFSDCNSEALDAEMWWTYSDGGEEIYLCLERQLRVGECFLGYESDEDKDRIFINLHGLMTSWGCDKSTVPTDFDYILQVTALTNSDCPIDSRSWDFRGGNLCARVV